jgi:hypothetical protein
MSDIAMLDISLKLTIIIIPPPAPSRRKPAQKCREIKMNSCVIKSPSPCSQKIPKQRASQHIIKR